MSQHDQVAVGIHILRLVEFGPTLPYPWSSQIPGELRELRADADFGGLAGAPSAFTTLSGSQAEK